jgi:hypothetical protein
MESSLFIYKNDLPGTKPHFTGALIKRFGKYITIGSVRTY